MPHGQARGAHGIAGRGRGTDGYSRFDEFQANIGLSSSMLKTLVKRGVLERRPCQRPAGPL